MVTSHAAFHTAAHYLGVNVVQVPVDPGTFKADVGEVAKAIGPNTILIVGSAPSYTHGVIDPIREMAELALENQVLFHCDACMGGFMLPYFRRLGVEVPEFDFSVPGVTSISVDLHKYAYAAKGASIILYCNKEIRRYQIFACSHWTGYTVVNNAVQSSKSGEAHGGCLGCLLLMCAWHDADAVVLAGRLGVKSPAVTGRKGNANKARAGSRNGPSGGSMRQKPCT